MPTGFVYTVTSSIGPDDAVETKKSTVRKKISG